MEVDNLREEVDGIIVRMALDGTILSETMAVTAHHAAIELSGGRFAHLGRNFIVSPEKTFMTDRVLIAIEGDETGTESTEVFDYYADWWGSDLSYFWLPVGAGGFDIFGYANVVDMTHSNSIAAIESENALYPFARVLDTLLEVEIDTANIRWQMSGLHSDFTFPNGDPVYEGQNASRLWSHGHFSQIWPGGLTMFDNGLNYAPPLSSIVEIAFDEASGTAHEVFRYALPEGGFTESLGDVWKLDSGNYVASWMSLGTLTEVTPDGELVWRLDTEPGTAVRRLRAVSDLYDFTPLATPAP
jgi:hypothetical protein